MPCLDAEPGARDRAAALVPAVLLNACPACPPLPQIYVIILAKTDHKIFALNVLPSNTILHVKAKIQAKEGEWA